MYVTKQIFRSFAGFKKEIRRVYGDIDEKKTAVRHLFNLKQTGSAIAYATEFQRHATKTGWDTEALISHYLKGLKEFIKDDMAHVDEPRTINEVIELSVKTDNRLYERRRDQKGGNSGKESSGKSGNSKKWKSHGRYKSEETKQLSATGKLSDKEKTRRYEGKLCFDCGKPGHQARNCGKNSNKKPWGKGKQISAATKEVAVYGREELTEEELEQLGIHGQLDVARAQREHQARPPVEGTEMMPLQVAIPRQGQQWVFQGVTEMGNHYTHLETHESFYNTRTCDNNPEEGKTYVVWISDPRGIIFMEEKSRLRTAEILSSVDDTTIDNEAPTVPETPKEGDILEEESSEESSSSEDENEVHLRGERALELIWKSKKGKTHYLDIGEEWTMTSTEPHKRWWASENNGMILEDGKSWVKISPGTKYKQIGRASCRERV